MNFYMVALYRSPSHPDVSARLSATTKTQRRPGYQSVATDAVVRFIIRIACKQRRRCLYSTSLFY